MDIGKPCLTTILAVALTISEALALIPSVRANGIISFIILALKTLKNGGK